MSKHIKSVTTSNIDTHLDEALVKDAGAVSLETVQPARDVDAESTKPRLQTVATPKVTRESTEKHSLQEVTPQHLPSDANASDMLETVMRIHIIRPPRYKVSTYTPSSLRMYFILHSMNLSIMNNFYARREMPALHPLPVRIYFGILFFVQTLRCMSFVNRIKTDQSDFIHRFLGAYPPEDLHIPGPLLALFKTLSTSQPEDTSFGKVSPSVLNAPGPSSKDDLVEDDSASRLLPQIPILLSMNQELANLPTNVASESEWSPIKPGTGNLPVAKSFMGYSFGTERSTWGDQQAWALSAPGIEFPIEANASLMSSYRDNAFILDIPDAGESIEYTEDFLGLYDLEWFGRLNEMMSIYAKYFHGSGTLSDCSLSGVSSNQIFTEYQSQTPAMLKPTGFGDSKSRVRLSAKHYTTTRSMEQLYELMAFNGQTNVSLSPTHPIAPLAGSERNGPFWSIRPINGPSPLDESYLGIPAKVTKLHSQKGSS